MKTYISIFFLFFISFSFAQKFETSIALSSGISKYSSSSQIEISGWGIKNGEHDFCFSGAIKEEFYFPKIISLAIEMGYLIINGKFVSRNPLSQNGIPEEYDIYKHILSTHSLEVPVLLKFRTKNPTKGVYFNFGMGISYLIYAYRNVERQTGYMGADPTNIYPLTKGKVPLKTFKGNQIGASGIFSIGKNFPIENKIFFCELRYRSDLNKWAYSTVNEPVDKYFDIKRHSFMLNLGIKF